MAPQDTVNSYNGFPPEQRFKALRWYQGEVAAGRRQRPTVCDLCGNGGVVDAHSEDYSDPFGEQTGKYALCYACHMMIHCRFTAPTKWRRYVAELKQGKRPVVFWSRSWDTFKSGYLKGDFVTMIDHGVMTELGKELLGRLK